MGKAEASWIWMGRRRRETDCHLLFRRQFELKRDPGAGQLRIAASDQYRLYVNGRIVGDGPARSEIPNAYVDTYPVEQLPLRKGANCIAVLAHNTMLPQHGQSLVPGGLWVDLECRADAGRPVRIRSGKKWRVAPALQFSKPAPRRFFAVGFNEKVDFAAQPLRWTRPGFDDGAWETAVEVGNRFYRRLVGRPIPMLQFEDWRPVSVRRCGTIGPLDGAWGLAFDQCAELPPGDELVFGTYVYSGRACTALFSFGCDNWSRLRVNGDLIWEQGRPDAGFVNHLEYGRDKYAGMLNGNGHRFEPGRTRKSAAERKDRVRLKRGWNRLTVWIKWPHRTYGFEGCFFDSRSGERLPAVCSASKGADTPGTWTVVPVEDGRIQDGLPVESLVADMGPYLEPSHLFDWDIQQERRSAFSGAKALLADSRGKGPMVLPVGGFAECQLPRDGAGFIDVELRGPKGTLVDVTISEAQTAQGRMRSLYNGLWQTDRLTLSGRWDRWLSLDRRAGRYLCLTVRHGTGPVQVRRLALRSQHYPVQKPGRFACSDPTLTWMWEAGARTVDAATFDVAEDCPTREKAQWGGDTYLRLFETAYLWGDLSLSAKAAREFAEDQKPDRWCRPMVPSGYGDKLVEYCFLLPPWVRQHYTFTGDMELVRDTWRGVKNLLDYADSLGDRRGFAQPGKDPRNHTYIDYTMPPLDRCGDTIGVMQCCYILALEDAACLADLLGKSKRAAGWRKRARRVRSQTRRYFWVEQEGLFADGIRKGQPDGTFSAVSNYWMLLADVPTVQQERRMLRRLWHRADRENMALWQRGESPYSKFFMSEALLRRGLWRQAFAAWRGYYGSMRQHPEAHCVFEMWRREFVDVFPLPGNSLVHPFGIGPMAHLAMYVAGVRPLHPGFDGILWEPMPGDLKWMKAEFPIVGRDETVAVEMKTLPSGARRLTLIRPPGMEVQVSEAFLVEGDEAIVRDRTKARRTKAGPAGRKTDQPRAVEAQARAAEQIARTRQLALARDPACADELRGALAHDEPAVRRLAIYGLERLGDAGNAPAIAPLTDDPDSWVRRTAATALGKLGNCEAAAPLVAALSHKDVQLRLHALVALGRIGDPASQKSIIEAMRDRRIWSELSVGQQEAILHVIERDWFTDRGAVDVLRWLLGYRDWEHPEFDGLEETRPARYALQVANMAAQVLASKFGDPAGERHLIDGLAENYQMQQRSARALGLVRSTAAVPRLAEMLDTPGEDDARGRPAPVTMRYAIRALAAIGDRRAVPPLEELLAHEDIMIRREAAEATERIDGRRRTFAPDGPPAVHPTVADGDLGTPGGRRPPQFIVIGVDDCTTIEGLEAMLAIVETLAVHDVKMAYTMWVAPLMGDVENRDMLKMRLLLQRLFDTGSEIAHHTLHHNPGGRNWGSLSPEVQIEEVEGCTRWYRENIRGFTRPFSHKGGGGGRGQKTDPEFTEQLLARQDFIYRAFHPARFGGEHPQGLHPNQVHWPRPDDPTPLLIETSALDGNAPPVQAVITHGVQGNIPGQFDYEVPDGVAMMKANFDYLYGHPRRPIFTVNAYHDWGLKTWQDSMCAWSHRNEGAILREFLLDVLVREREKYPDTHCVTFRQVVEYVRTKGDLDRTLAIGNGQDSRNPVRPSTD